MESFRLRKPSYYSPIPMFSYTETGIVCDYNPAMEILFNGSLGIYRNQPIERFLSSLGGRIIGEIVPINLGNKRLSELTPVVSPKVNSTNIIHFDSETFGNTQLKCSSIVYPAPETGHANLLGIIVYIQILSIEKCWLFEEKLHKDLNHHLQWEQYAISYDAILTRMPYYQEVLDRHMHAFDQQEIQSVLELGSGTGNVVINMLEAGLRVTAVDYSRAMLEQLRRKIKGNNENLMIIEQNAEHLIQFNDESFDGVSILLALFDMENPEVALDEAIRVLRTGGKLVITEPKQCFKLEPLLNFINQYLKEQNLTEILAADMDRVFKVNEDQNFNPSTRDKGSPLRVEVIWKILKGRGFRSLSTKNSHFGNCATVEGIKPV